MEIFQAPEEHRIFVYDQELEQEVELDTLNLQVEADLEADLEVEQQMAIEMNMVLDNPEDAVDPPGDPSQSGSAPVKKRKKVRLLRKEERTLVQGINKAAVIMHVTKSVPTGLVSSLFPERKRLWDSISNTNELTIFIEHLADKYILLYEKYSKGREKYANLYLAWLDAIRSYTCKSQQTQTTKAELAPVLARHETTVSDSTQATVLSCVLHAVQEEIQSQMATQIQSLATDQPSFTEKPADETSLYRISGWAIKSAIDYRLKKKDKQEELQLLKALKRSQASKSTLPAGAQFLDRGGLTFIKPEFLQWIREVEESIKKHLNQKGYQKYGKNIFRVTRDSIVSDALLLQRFKDTVDGVFPIASTEIVTKVHGILLTKIYNARSNEFLRSIGKIECFSKNKAVDANISLRDKLKSYAVEKQSSTATI